LERIALFPGSFDPVTLGHVEIIERGTNIFDKVIVALGTNSTKKYRFTEAQRIEMLHLAFDDIPRVEILEYDGLTVSFAQAHGSSFLLRGLRSAADLAYEQPTSLSTVTLLPAWKPFICTAFQRHSISRQPLCGR
jgi:pantetheine-phosphate adenylyltransferase